MTEADRFPVHRSFPAPERRRAHPISSSSAGAFGGPGRAWEPAEARPSQASIMHFINLFGLLTFH